MPRVMSAREQTLLATLGAQLGVAVENQRLVSREKEMAISEERNLLAQELHDSIAQSLAFLNLQVQMLGGAMKRDDRNGAQVARQEIEAGVRECYADVRELLLHFRTRSSHEDIHHALRTTLQKFEQQTGIRVLFSETGDAMPIPADAQVQVLHIIQEALSNVRKHAGADLVDVAVRRGPVYIFTVRDNGRGFQTDGDAHPGESELHVGLSIMRERARRAGADLVVESAAGKGTCVTLSLAVSALAPAAREHA
jgi:two-component system nitrate/nitrite sensor histidine kinase NarX